jgi:hypothetical protein
LSNPHKGMPPLKTDGPALSYFEFWPTWIFYFPIYVYVLWLMIRYRGITLPTLANPSFPGGGLVGESKAEILDLLIKYIPEWTAPFTKQLKKPSIPIEVQVTESLIAIQKLGFNLPIVAKPDLGCRGAGVRLLKTEIQLKSYIQDFPDSADFLLQKLADFEGEAGVFYVRHPREPKGRILSLTLKYFPYVYGDGTSTLRELILHEKRAGLLSHLYLKRHESRLDLIPTEGEPVRLAFAGSHSRGAIFRNGNHLITPAMVERFEEISRKIPEFYFGRFDIRFSEFSELQAGRGFTIVEANGAGAESTHIWDRKTSLLQAYSDLFLQYRLLFQISTENRRRGFKPLSMSEFRHMYQREKMLTNLYPPTD